MGETKITDLPWIATGPDGSTGIGNHGTAGDGLGSLALFGPKTVMGSGPLGHGPRIVTRKVVYLLDHSGSMLDTFDYLREEVKAAVNRLQPFQYFSVIMFSEDVTVLGPDHLRRATKEAMSDICLQIGEEDTPSWRGGDDDMLKPFQDGFEKALAMKPEVIVFLTDGNFDPRLVGVVKGLNRGGVKIYTIAYVQITPEAGGGVEGDREGGGVGRISSWRRRTWEIKGLALERGCVLGDRGDRWQRGFCQICHEKMLREVWQNRGLIRDFR